MKENLHHLTISWEKSLKIADLYQKQLVSHIKKLLNHHSLLIPFQKQGEKGGGGDYIECKEIGFFLQIYVDHQRENLDVEHLLLSGRFTIQGGYLDDLHTLAPRELSAFAHELEKVILNLEVEAEYKAARLDVND